MVHHGRLPMAYNQQIQLGEAASVSSESMLVAYFPKQQLHSHSEACRYVYTYLNYYETILTQANGACDGKLFSKQRCSVE